MDEGGSLGHRTIVDPDDPWKWKADNLLYVIYLSLHVGLERSKVRQKLRLSHAQV